MSILDDLERAEREATVGPWYVERGARADFLSSRHGPVVDLEITGRKISTEQADAALIALLRNHAAELLAVVRAAQVVTNCSLPDSRLMEALAPFRESER